MNSSDWVGLALDTRDDNRTAYNFIINAAGSKVDAYIYDDERYDRSWDGVWDAQVKITNEGWVAEFRLPFFHVQLSPYRGSYLGSHSEAVHIP